jgi:hypothetical protein
MISGSIKRSSLYDAETIGEIKPKGGKGKGETAAGAAELFVIRHGESVRWRIGY